MTWVLAKVRTPFYFAKLKPSDHTVSSLEEQSESTAFVIGYW